LSGVDFGVIDKVGIFEIGNRIEKGLLEQAKDD